MGQQTDNRRKRKLKLWHFLVLAAGLLIVVFTVYRVGVRSKLQERLSTLRAAGYPVTLAELDQWYETPPFGENAAELVTTAVTYLQIPEGDEAPKLPVLDRRPLPPRTHLLDEETRGLAEQLIADNTEALEVLEEITSLTSSRYPIDLTQGHMTLLPNLSEHRQITHLLCLRAALEADRGQPTEAVETLGTALSVADSLGKEPILISQMVRQGSQSSVISTAEWIVNRAALEDGQLKRLGEFLSNAHDPNAYVRGFIGEMCMTIAALRDPESAGMDLPPIVAPEGPSLLQIRVAQVLGQVDRYLVKYIDLMDGHIAATRLPPWERQKAIEAITSRAEELRQAHRVISYFQPSLKRCILLDLENLTRLRVASVGIAVERYRAAHGALPDRLEALVPEYLDTAPVDPFDGQPLRYRTLDPGFVVYSVGKDLSDDDGTEQPPRQKRTDPPAPCDITFIVER